MKTKTLWYLLFSCTSFYAQEHTKLEKDDNFYLTINKEESFFVKNSSKKDNTIRLTENNILDLKGKNLDIYLNWLNPLQFKLTIQDSVINDVRVEEVKKFFSENISAISQNNLNAKRGHNDFDCATIDANNKVSLLFPELFNIFEDTNSHKLKPEYCIYWNMLKDINSINLSDDNLKKYISALCMATTPTIASKAIEEGESEIANFREAEDEITAILFYSKKMADEITEGKDISLKNRMLEIYEKQKQKLSSIRKLCELLKLYIAQVKPSLQKESRDFAGHYRLKSISLTGGKSSKINISLAERELKDDFSIAEKGEIKKITILIQKYDFITPKVGTGVFYASTTLNGFGTATNDAGELTVVRDDIKKDTAVTGAFLNLVFDISSQFLSPYIQLGVDPTKERPLLLLGGGLAIMNHFAITGGPLWTWEPELKSLSEGGVVSSTNALEDDISYKFRTKPKGFYIGLSYSF